MTLSKDKGIILSPGNLTLSKLYRQAYTIQSQDGDIVASEGTAKAETQGPASVAGRGEVHTGTLFHLAHLTQMFHVPLWEWAQSQLDWNIDDAPSLEGLSLFFLNLDKTTAESG